MIGNSKKNDRTFKIEEYEDFYSNHWFEPIPEDMCTIVNEVIPRFGWAFDKVEELKPKNVLDLACLDGSFVLTIGKQLGVNGTGVDLTIDGIRLAADRAKKFGVRATFEIGTIEEWLEEYANIGKKFDMITMFEIIEHVKDVPRLLKLIDSVLAPGGSVLVSTPDFESPIFGANDDENKCHLRLYTTADEDYERENDYGVVRHATSISKEIGKDRIKEMLVFNELINVWYQ